MSCVTMAATHSAVYGTKTAGAVNNVGRFFYSGYVRTDRTYLNVDCR